MLIAKTMEVGGKFGLNEQETKKTKEQDTGYKRTRYKIQETKIQEGGNIE